MLKYNGPLPVNENQLHQNERIYVVTQYFVPPHKERVCEIKRALRENIHNDNIDKIFLLNERLYEENELGVSNPRSVASFSKVHQEIIYTRLKYLDFWNWILKHKDTHPGYYILTNADISFGDTLQNVRKFPLFDRKIGFALLRWEKDNVPFGPVIYSQDTWIIHSKDVFDLNHTQQDALSFELGQPGCDNRITSVWIDFGFTLFNEPSLIKTLHHHKSAYRTYTKKEVIKGDYTFILPHFRILPYERLPIQIVWTSFLSQFTGTFLQMGKNELNLVHSTIKKYNIKVDQFNEQFFYQFIQLIFQGLLYANCIIPSIEKKKQEIPPLFLHLVDIPLKSTNIPYNCQCFYASKHFNTEYKTEYRTDLDIIEFERMEAQIHDLERKIIRKLCSDTVLLNIGVYGYPLAYSLAKKKNLNIIVL